MLPSTQTLADIAEGNEIEAFNKIKEVDLKHATNIVDTSTIESTGQAKMPEAPT
jgi:hypothetical protein